MSNCFAKCKNNFGDGKLVYSNLQTKTNSSTNITLRDFDLIEYPNGLTIMHKQVPHTRIQHVGYVVNIGSRDEKISQQGMAHFWEHMAFKGTGKRRSFHILNRLEVVGGELNAYTTKEKICFYASVLNNHADKAIELLTDITFHSVFPEKEIEKEKGVILEEMSMYEDSPEDDIQDHFDQLLFTGHPLGHKILGSEETVNSFSKTDFKEFLDQNLDSSRMILTSLSNLTTKEIKKLGDKYVKDLPLYSAPSKRKPFFEFERQESTIFKPIQQAHCMLGGLGFSFTDEERLPFFMLINLLGGPGMTSRLNMKLREKNGLVYSVESGFAPYSDTGQYHFYFATEKSRLEKSLKLLFEEVKLVKEKALGTLQLHQTKEQLMGQIAMAEENNLSLMLTIGKSLLDSGKMETLPELFEKINAVKASHLLELANRIFVPEKMCMVTFMPED